MLDWRKGWNDFAHDVINVSVKDDLVERLAIGKETYGPDFVGNPLEHLWEECCDALIYASAARVERDAHMDLLKQALNCIRDLREYLPKPMTIMEMARLRPEEQSLRNDADKTINALELAVGGTEG